jgi:Leucine-rich repeat (LRR) protein
LDISNNKLSQGEWRNTQGDYDRNNSNNYASDMSGVIMLADAIKDMRALSFLNVKDNKIGDDGKRSRGKAIQESNVQFLVCDEWSVTQDTTELDVSGKDLQAAGAALLGGVISNNGALKSLDISSNNLVGKKGTGRYETVDAEYSDESDEEEEIMEPDFSGIIAIANAIPDMGAMTSLNLASNGLGAEGAKIIAAFLPKCT